MYLMYELKDLCIKEEIYIQGVAFSGGYLFVEKHSECHKICPLNKYWKIYYVYLDPLRLTEEDSGVFLLFFFSPSPSNRKGIPKQSLLYEQL